MGNNNQTQEERLRNLPILLVFNKADNLSQVDKVMIESMFQVQSLLTEFPNFNFVFCSALLGDHVGDVLAWISTSLFAHEKGMPS